MMIIIIIIIMIMILRKTKDKYLLGQNASNSILSKISKSLLKPEKCNRNQCNHMANLAEQRQQQRQQQQLAAAVGIGNTAEIATAVGSKVVEHFEIDSAELAVIVAERLHRGEMAIDEGFVDLAEHFYFGFVSVVGNSCNQPLALGMDTDQPSHTVVERRGRTVGRNARSKVRKSHRTVVVVVVGREP